MECDPAELEGFLAQLSLDGPIEPFLVFARALLGNQREHPDADVEGPAALVKS